MAVIDTWGVSEKGFYRPTLEDIITEKNKKAKELFGEDFNVDENTPQGKFFRINAAAENKLCEIAEDIYYSIAPSTARGISLDRVCEFANITRDSAGYAEHQLKVYGKQGYVIEAGTMFKNADEVEFYSVMEAVIETAETQGEDEKYFAEVIVQCTESGTIGNVQDINNTSEVDTNIENVVYQKVIAYGTPIESDPELRDRFSSTVTGLGTNTTNAIKANVLRLSGINDVIIIDNNTDTDNVLSNKLTVKSQSYAVIVHSDDMDNDIEIAEAIQEKAPLGIMQSGNKTVVVKDDSNTEHTVKFSYVEPLPVAVTCTCYVTNAFPSDGVEMIEDNITSYINGLGIGEEIIFSRLYDFIYNVTGVHKVSDLTLVGGTIDIKIPPLNIAKVAQIYIDVVEV